MNPSVDVEWECEEMEKTKVDYLEAKFENSFLHKGDDEKLINLRIGLTRYAFVFQPD